MILLVDKKHEGENKFKRKFSRYEVITTGLSDDDLKILVDIYLKPEFKEKDNK
jgi:hypothetical protein